MDMSRLAQIIQFDAARKGGLLDNHDLSADVIQNSFSITSQVNHSMAILPANGNTQSDHERKMTLAKNFRANEREMIAGRETNLANLYIIPTPQKIKANVFSSVGKGILNWSILDQYRAFGQVKTSVHSTQVVPAKTVFLEEPSYTGSNVIPLFPMKNLAHTA